jgi:hypothetical protein
MVVMLKYVFYLILSTVLLINTNASELDKDDPLKDKEKSLTQSPSSEYLLGGDWEDLGEEPTSPSDVVITKAATPPIVTKEKKDEQEDNSNAVKQPSKDPIEKSYSELDDGPSPPTPFQCATIIIIKFFEPAVDFFFYSTRQIWTFISPYCRSYTPTYCNSFTCNWNDMLVNIFTRNSDHKKDDDNLKPI